MKRLITKVILRCCKCTNHVESPRDQKSQQDICEKQKSDQINSLASKEQKYEEDKSKSDQSDTKLIQTIIGESLIQQKLENSNDNSSQVSEASSIKSPTKPKKLLSKENNISSNIKEDPKKNQDNINQANTNNDCIKLELLKVEEEEDTSLSKSNKSNKSNKLDESNEQQQKQQIENKQLKEYTQKALQKVLQKQEKKNAQNQNLDKRNQKRDSMLVNLPNEFLNNLKKKNTKTKSTAQLFQLSQQKSNSINQEQSERIKQKQKHQTQKNIVPLPLQNQSPDKSTQKRESSSPLKSPKKKNVLIINV